MSVVRRPALRVSAAVDGEAAVLRLAGELDLATADVLREHVREAVGTDGVVRRLVLDLAGLEFLDVTGLGAVLEARRRMAASGGDVVLRRPRPMVLRMLSLLELEDAVQVEH